MTVEEAKKILEKEGFKLEGPGKPRVVSKSFTEYESHEICEAMQTVCSVGYEIKMSFGVIEARKTRLRLELAENIKTPGPGEEQPKEGNPALKESASQFNDALLDEQAKKITELTKEKSNLEYQITILNACKEHNENVYRKQIKRLGKEIARLNKVIHDKNITIKNLVLERGRVARLLAAEQTTHKIDLQATTSAESALIYKEKEYEKSLQEKDEVIDDLSRELARSKEREEELIATVKDYLNEIEELKKSRRGEIKTMKELLKKMENAACKAVNTENTAAARYAKKAMSERMVIPNSRIVVFSSRSPRNNFLDEFRKSFFED